MPHSTKQTNQTGAVVTVNHNQFVPVATAFGAIQGGVVATCTASAPAKLAVDTLVHMGVRAVVMHYTGTGFTASLGANALATGLVTAGHGPIIAGTILATGAIATYATIAGTVYGARLIYDIATREPKPTTHGSSAAIVEEPNEAPTITYNSDTYSNNKFVTLSQLENILDGYSSTSYLSFRIFQHNSYEVDELKKLVASIKQELSEKNLNIDPKNCQISLGYLAQVIEKQKGCLSGTKEYRINALKDFDYYTLSDKTGDTDRILRSIIQAAAGNSPALMIEEPPRPSAVAPAKFH